MPATAGLASHGSRKRFLAFLDKRAVNNVDGDTFETPSVLIPLNPFEQSRGEHRAVTAASGLHPHPSHLIHVEAE